MKFAYDYFPAGFWHMPSQPSDSISTLTPNSTKSSLLSSSSLVIVLHGLMGSRADDDALKLPDWRELTQLNSAVQPNLAVLRYDARGHGESPFAADAGTDEPEQGYTWKALAKDLIEVIQWALREYNHTDVILVGSSMGAGTALWATVAAPTLPIRGLVLAIPSTTGAQRDATRTVVRRWADIIEEQGVEAFINLLSSSPKTPILEEAIPEYRDITLPRIAKMHPTALINMFRGAALSNFPSEEALTEISCPTLILCRDKDSMHPLSAGEYLQKLLPNNQLIITNQGSEIKFWPKKVLTWLQSVPQS